MPRPRESYAEEPSNNSPSGSALMSGPPTKEVTPQWLCEMLALNIETSLGIKPTSVTLKLRRKGSDLIQSAREVQLYWRDAGHEKAASLLAKAIGLPKPSTESEKVSGNSLELSEEELLLHLVAKQGPEGRRRLLQWLTDWGDNKEKQEDETLKSLSKGANR